MPRDRETHLAAVAGFCCGLLSLVLVLIWIVGKDRYIGRLEGRIDRITEINSELTLLRTYVETLRTAMIKAGIHAPPLPTEKDHEPGSMLQKENL